MRIGNQTIVRNYTSNLGKNLSALNRANDRSVTNRRFDSMAESTSLGVRAMKVRRSMEKLENYMDTAKTVEAKFKSAEDQMRQVSSLAQSITDRYLKGLNDTATAEDRKIMASEIEALQKQFLTAANGQFSESFVFGGTNTTKPPFTADAAGKLFYNGVDVAEMAGADGKLKPEYQYLMDDVNYVDLGLGMAMKDGQVVGSTGFVSTVNGLDFFGIGDDNIYNVTSQMIAALRDPDFKNSDTTQALVTKMRDAQSTLLTGVTNLGTQSSYLTENIRRMEGDLITLSERQNALEFTDPATAIMNFKMQEFAYNAALQMGQRLLQPTLFNFIS